MIGKYDLHLYLDDPRTLSHSDLISIFTYLYCKSDSALKDLIPSEKQSIFLQTILGAYDAKMSLNIVPIAEFDWGEFNFVFESDNLGDGLKITVSYAADRLRPSLTDTTTETKASIIPSAMPVGEPRFTSPYRPYYWYEKYDYKNDWEKVNAFWEPLPHDCAQYLEDLEAYEGLLESSDSEKEEEESTETATLEVLGNLTLSHEELITTIGLIQE